MHKNNAIATKLPSVNIGWEILSMIQKRLVQDRMLFAPAACKRKKHILFFVFVLNALGLPACSCQWSVFVATHLF